MHYKNYEGKDTYLKAYSRFIQPLTSMNLWPKSTLPAIEPPVIIAMPGRPKNQRRKAADEPKKKFGKGTRIERQMRCSLCKTLGHNKKGFPLTRNQGGRAGTSSVGGETAESGTATSTATGSASATAGSTLVPAAGSSTIAGSASVPTAGSSTTPSTMESVAFTLLIIDPSTQQSTNITGGPKRKTNEPRRGGVNVGSKRPKTAGYSVLFDSSGTVIQRSGTTDKVVHNSSTLISSAPTNIELRFKPLGLKWKGRAAVTQRQLQEQSYRRAKSTTTTQATLVTQSTPSSQATTNIN
ncbi:uncharacterized protein [Nicotiana sylvestris]|uniref:Uncharacterized protein LOC104235461 isoform X1 n=2 Tax=Nicotiana sylvestris TaxID=4096 RepID=A0A1U7XD17_NICSY|nr:PREDICTED: uncharacterized protein LOC104235461 isoform X1 [Nicotiana sylvestris]